MFFIYFLYARSVSREVGWSSINTNIYKSVGGVNVCECKLYYNDDYCRCCVSGATATWCWVLAHGQFRIHWKNHLNVLWWWAWKKEQNNTYTHAFKHTHAHNTVKSEKYSTANPKNSNKSTAQLKCKKGYLLAHNTHTHTYGRHVLHTHIYKWNILKNWSFTVQSATLLWPQQEQELKEGNLLYMDGCR